VVVCRCYGVARCFIVIKLSLFADVCCTVHAGEKELMRRLLRPHLQPGDALLFDCRALHFGLANTSGSKLHTEGTMRRADAWVSVWF
jgi:hypothetical protein